MNHLKLNLIVIAVFAFFNSTLAQDECSTATTIAPSTTCTYVTFDLPGTLTRSASVPTTCAVSNIVDDAWLKFTATGTLSTVSYQNTTASSDAAMWIYSGNCTTLSYINCTDAIAGVGTEEITFNTIVNTTYYVRIGRMSGNPNFTMNGKVCIKCIIPPVNDDASGATLVSTSTTCNYSYYSNKMATSSTSVAAPACGNYLGGDIWVKVVVPASKSLIITTDTGAITDVAMAIYTGAVGSLTLNNCYSDGGGSNGLMPKANLTCLTPGDTIRIRFWEAGNDVSGTFRLCIIDPQVSNTLTWVGAANTTWNNTNNWTSCAIPDTAKDIIIYSGASSQPVVADNSTINCRNLTIQSGATLTLGQNCILNVGGNYLNNGSLIMPVSSTIQFQNTAVQTLDGNLTGANQFGNFSVVKTGGSLTFLQDADIVGNWINNAGSTSVDMNGKKIRLKGNFTNPSASVTAPINSTLEFTGTNNQTYHEGSTPLDLQNIIINKTTGTLTLQSNMNVSNTGSLTLTGGVVVTGIYNMNIKNVNTTAIVGGGSTSYIQGNLIRAINGSIATYQFPIGNIAKGYQLASINFTNATNVTTITGRFDTWTGSAPNGPTSNDCGGANYGLLPMFNSGNWTFTSNPAVATGNYNMTIASIGHSNSGLNPGTTITKSINNGSTWSLDGACVMTSNGNLAARTAMSQFGLFAIGQTSSPLPIELLSFTGAMHEKYNELEWVTGTEKNNDFFTIEKSNDAINFETVGTVKGAGNSNVPLHYQLIDNHPSSGVSYYRLTQTDFDGTTTKSTIIALNRKNTNCFVNAFPNPSNGPCDLIVETTTLGYYFVYINDMAGKEMYRQFVQIEQSGYKHPINISEFKCGIYNCILENQITKEKTNVRLIKQ